MKDKHPIDKLFKNGLSDPDIPFDEKDWETLQKKLNAPKRRSMVKLMWIGGAVAASFVIAAIALFYDNAPSNGGVNPLSLEQPLPPAVADEEHLDKMSLETDKETRETATSERSHTQQRYLQHGTLPDDYLPKRIEENTSHQDKNKYFTQISSIKLAQTTSAKKPFDGQSDPIYPKAVHITPPMDVVEPPLEQDLIVDTKTSSRFTLAVAAAPDLSGTAPLNGRLGGNVGLLVTYNLNARFRINTGAWYARKLYQADFAAYRPLEGWPAYRDMPATVDADCRVLDIPINLDYTFKQHNHASWFLSGGVSSYIMLSEVYDFTYPGNEHHYPQQYKVRNENRHILGVVNLGVGYQRKFNPSIGITVQPFVKIPLSNIGHGNIKLYSTGVVLSADIDLTRRTKR